MKELIVGDVHFSESSSIIRSNGTKYTTRLENLIASLNWAEEIAVKYNCKRSVYLGDFFDRADLRAIELTALSEVKWAPIEHIFIVGNHEIARSDNSICSSAFLGLIPQMKVIKNPTAGKSGEQDILYLPYVLHPEGNEVAKYCEQFNLDKPIVFSHNDLAGFQYGTFVSEHGLDMKNIEDNVSLFINGHLHNGDEIGDKIINLGNLTGQNFTEDAARYKHNIMILDTETLTYDLIENPYGFKFYKFDFSSSSRDYIQKVFSKIKGKVIVSITCNPSDAEFMDEIINSKREEVDTSQLQIVEKRILFPVVKSSKTTAGEAEIKISNHIEKFYTCMSEKWSADKIAMEELKEVCK